MSLALKPATAQSACDGYISHRRADCRNTFAVLQFWWTSATTHTVITNPQKHETCLAVTLSLIQSCTVRLFNLFLFFIDFQWAVSFMQSMALARLGSKNCVAIIHANYNCNLFLCHRNLFLLFSPLFCRSLLSKWLSSPTCVVGRSGQSSSSRHCAKLSCPQHPEQPAASHPLPHSSPQLLASAAAASTVYY